MIAKSEFQRVLSELKKGGMPTVSATVEGKDYTRIFLPESRLIILGGGHIAQPLCRLAAQLDFSVTVVDDRPEFANTTRFPEARQVICDSFAKAIEALEIRSTDYVCVITRGHRWDKDCLRQILKGQFPFYLGMIGSHRRVGGLMDVLAKEGYSTADLGRIHAPIGIRINATTPAEIAVSICAELIDERGEFTRRNKEKYLEQTNTDYYALDFLAESDEPRAFALVLSSVGSTPVKAGSLMGIDRLGKGYGTIGGGCSESEVMLKARRIIGTGKDCIIDIDMTNDVAEDEGMVCGGAMKVWLTDVSD